MTWRASSGASASGWEIAWKRRIARRCEGTCLRQMGILDESEASQPRVIIANYLYMHADCIEGSHWYQYCCSNPCEDLMSQLERSIKAPHATPEEIVNLVSAMPAPSAPQKRTLAPALVRKLEDVADHHGGSVPLHGRLFAQWMHFAYPHECPYPQLSGTTTLSASLEEGEEAGASKLSLSEEEMRSYVESSPDIPRAAGCNMQDPEQDSCPIVASWLHEEELVDAAGWNATLAARELAARPAWRGVRSMVRACVLVAIVLSCMVSLRRTLQHGLSSSGVAGDQAGKSASKVGVISV